MRQASKRIPDSAEKTVRDIRRNTRRHHSAEEKIRVVLEGLRGEVSIAELCRKEGINQNLYYRWSKEFLEAGKKRLAGDRLRAYLNRSLPDAFVSRHEADRDGGHASSQDARPGQQGCCEGPANRRADHGGSQGLMPNFTLLDLSRPEIAIVVASAGADGRGMVGRRPSPPASPQTVTTRLARATDQTSLLPPAGRAARDHPGGLQQVRLEGSFRS
jgi:transposase